MKKLGIALAVIGALILAYFTFIGVETGVGGLRVTNIAGLFTGSALLISGCVLAGAGEITERLSLLAEVPRPVIVRETKFQKPHVITKKVVS